MILTLQMQTFTRSCYHTDPWRNNQCALLTWAISVPPTPHQKGKQVGFGIPAQILAEFESLKPRLQKNQKR